MELFGDRDEGAEKTELYDAGTVSQRDSEGLGRMRDAIPYSTV
jgi:hypothetical protein